MFRATAPHEYQKTLTFQIERLQNHPPKDNALIESLLARLDRDYARHQSFDSIFESSDYIARKPVRPNDEPAPLRSAREIVIPARLGPTGTSGTAAKKIRQRSA